MVMNSFRIKVYPDQVNDSLFNTCAFNNTFIFSFTLGIQSKSHTYIASCENSFSEDETFSQLFTSEEKKKIKEHKHFSTV